MRQPGAATDYLLYPSNAAPTKEWGGPYTRILVDTEAGSEDVFTKGMQTVQIVGKWGYREVTEDSGTDINNASGYTATDTSLVVDDGSKFAIAQTILIGSETTLHHQHSHQYSHRHPRGQR